MTVAVTVAGAVGYTVLKPAPPEPPAEVIETVAVVPEPAVAAPEPEPKAEVAPVPPRFDVVRVDPGGSALVAGQGEATAEVSIRIDGSEVAEARTDASGKFVALFDVDPSDAPQIVTLVMTLEDGEKIGSEETIILAPRPALVAEVEPAPEAEEEKVIIAAAEDPEAPKAEASEARKAEADTTAGEIKIVTVTPDVPAVQLDVGEVEEVDGEPVIIASVAPETPVVVETTAPEVEVAAAPEVEDAPKIEAPVEETPKVLRASEDGIEVLQGPELLDRVVIDTIAYEVEGEVTLAGRGSQDGFVRVYLDNQPVKTTQISPDGNWQANLPDIDTGVYVLRVDQVDTDGTVTARAETPFKREDEEVVKAAAEKRAKTETPAGVEVGVVTVQPGSTLWAIAREKYGKGDLYVRVFDANREHIKNPDLIYPGQVFTVPEDG